MEPKGSSPHSQAPTTCEAGCYIKDNAAYRIPTIYCRMPPERITSENDPNVSKHPLQNDTECSLQASNFNSDCY